MLDAMPVLRDAVDVENSRAAGLSYGHMMPGIVDHVRDRNDADAPEFEQDPATAALPAIPVTARPVGSEPTIVVPRTVAADRTTVATRASSR